MATPRALSGAGDGSMETEMTNKQVWVLDDKEGYLPGVVMKEEHDIAEVSVGSELRRIPLTQLWKKNPPKFDRVDDIADLTYLNEPSVVYNLRLRYGSEAIYTYSGLFLVAINPYRNLPLYTDAIVQQYRNKRRDENPPHIFAIAERAWVNMGEERENQSILITGESGAGKTENTKKVIQYLAAIATDVHPSHNRSPSIMSQSSFNSGLPRSASAHRKSLVGGNSTGVILTAKGRLGLLERQILQANPILEAFGNAQTQRNNNSSRFGKFIRISFAPDGSISGANVDWCLLEKSRVVIRSEAERSFHVFYQLLESESELKGQLLLDGGIEDYEYLNKSRREIDGVNDKEEWRQLKSALDVVGFTAAEQFDLFRIVAAILHIGNIEITATRADDAVMPSTALAERVCYLLGVPVAEFTRAVLRPRVLAGREWVTQARTRKQALDELSALCKTLYEKCFGALVDKINSALDRPSSKSTFIGVLDIAGFEIFEINTYEQLLINYTNEKLQQFFNHHMFVLEQEEYSREGIEWDYVNFGLDLQPTIDLIESNGNPIGVLSCLDEDCIMPKATDLTFTQKLHQHWRGDAEDSHPGCANYAPARFEQGFIIQHYAGKVEYRTEGWLEKNKDPLNDNIVRLLAASDEPFVATLFAEYKDSAALTPSAAANGVVPAGRKRVVKKGAFRTVGQRHKEQLATMMNQLHSTQPHFVRCIVPNEHKKPDRVDVPLVLDQLRCNGVLEGIRIARLGYPNRLPFVDFRQRYEVLTPGIIPRGFMDGRKACLRIIDALELDQSFYRIGTSKIFFKAGVLADLEERRDELLNDIFSRFQAVAKAWMVRRQMRKILNRANAVRTIQRNARIYGDPWMQLFIKVRPLLIATRSDEELRRKEAELALVKERAERDQREKEALEKLKMQLEAEKRKVEEDLEAERTLALDKDALLERSKKREMDLEDDVTALQLDLEELDRHLDKALASRKAIEEKYDALKGAFDEAAEHLVRFEAERDDLNKKEAELSQSLKEAESKESTLIQERDTLRVTLEEVRQRLAEREEDLIRLKERTDLAMTDLEARLASEIRNRDLGNARSETLEQEARQAKELLAELARTADEYSEIIKKKELDITRVTSELLQLSDERERSTKEILRLQGRVDTLTAELGALRLDHRRDGEVKEKLQQELDELRNVLHAKSSEEERRKEVEKSKDQELLELRTHVAQLHQELSDSRSIALEGQNKLKIELESIQRQYGTLQHSYQELVENEQENQTRRRDVELALSEANKFKRTLESELQATKSKNFDTEGKLSETVKAKETLERQLASALAKQSDYEEAVIQVEREKNTWVRQLEQLRKQLEDETAKRQQLDKQAAVQKSDLIRVKDRAVKLDRELNKALDALKAREWEIKQLESRQDKTIVEHVHVLEEAKRVTDRQLADAQRELQEKATYIKSLEKMRINLSREAEDLSREAQQIARTKEKAFREQEERTRKAVAETIDAKRAKDAAEIQARRYQTELEDTKAQLEDVHKLLAGAQQSKKTLETELTQLADEIDTPGSMAKIRRQYETKIAALQGELEDANLEISTAARIKEAVERQHAEIRKLVMSSGSTDDEFRTRLLHELQQTERSLQAEMHGRSLRMRSTEKSDIRSFGNLPPSTPTKANNKPLNGVIRSGKDLPEPLRTPERQIDHRQVDQLRQQIQGLELQMVASERVRHHLETSLREMTSDFDKLDGSKQSIEAYRQRLRRENSRLQELLNDEAKARQASESSHIEGLQDMWNKFQNTISEERESYTRLEDSRRALLLQQRTAQAELVEQRRQLQDLTNARVQLQGQIANLQDRVEREQLAKSEESTARRKLQADIQDLRVTAAAASSKHSELQEAVKAYRAKAEEYRARLDRLDIERSKAITAENFARKALEDVERSHSQLVAERNAAQELADKFEKRYNDLQARLDEVGHSSSEAEVVRIRLEEELQRERDQHGADLDERDFAMKQTQQTYQDKLAELTSDVQSMRDSLSKLREENRKLRSDYDELQSQYDNEIYSSGAWKNEKERLETKINDLNNAYESSTAARAEQQAQIVALHSEIRNLRGIIDDAEAERLMLQKARRALQSQLDGIKFEHINPDKMSAESKLQDLQLKKQDLERSLEEHQDRVVMAEERMRKAEVREQECQDELSRVCVENTELERLNANLEKQIKELNVRIVDLETKAYTSRMASKSEAVRLQRTGDVKKLHEEEINGYELKMLQLREELAEVTAKEGNLKKEKRELELEATDYKRRALTLEHEVERLRGRLERPSTVAMRSPATSPRKPSTTHGT